MIGHENHGMTFWITCEQHMIYIIISSSSSEILVKLTLRSSLYLCFSRDVIGHRIRDLQYHVTVTSCDNFG